MNHMQLPKWVVLLLGVAFNTIASLQLAGIPKAGTQAAMIVTIVGMVLANVLILVGVPIVGGKADPSKLSGPDVIK